MIARITIAEPNFNVTTNGAYIVRITLGNGLGSTQVQSDWNQTNNTLVDFIKNKPTISGSNTGDETQSSIATKLGILISEVFAIPISDVSTVITTGIAKKTEHWPYNFTAVSAFVGLGVTSSGTSFIVDVNDKDGNSIFGTRPTILAGEYTSLTNPTQPTLVTTSFIKGDKITFDVDTAGTGCKEATVFLIGYKS